MFSLNLTGAPATGRSTFARAVADQTEGLYPSYGELLAPRLSERVQDQTELRAMSSAVITHADVASADDEVQEVIVAASREANVVVDSHAMTREHYGFSAVQYELAQGRRLPYSHIVCLWADREVVRSRIDAKAEGRPSLSDEEFDMHAQLQSSLALTYAHSGGLSIAFINSAGAIASVVSEVVQFAESR